MKKACTEYEIWISAAIDGELEITELAELEAHLDRCPTCRQQFKKLGTVNDWLIAQDVAADKSLVDTATRLESALPVNGTSHKRTVQWNRKPPARSGHSSSKPRNLLRRKGLLAGGMLAASAAGLAALLSPSFRDVSNQSPAAEVFLPVEQVSYLNEQSRSIQFSQARVMEQELRTLKLLAQYSEGDQAEIESIEQQIDSLMQRVQALHDTPLFP